MTGDQGNEGVHLAVDVGNTESVVGLFRSDDLEVARSWRLSTGVPRTADEFELLLRSLLKNGNALPVQRAVVGSVVPTLTGPLVDALGRLAQGNVHVVDSTSPLPIRLDVEEPRTVGADRIVNTLAASHLYSVDTIVVDLGTATTYDCITAGGVFCGGVIAPGVSSGEDWLAGRTAKLPRVQLRPPDRVVGRRTETCLQSGIFYSAVEAMDGIVERIRGEWGRNGANGALVVATGGYAPILAPHSRTVEKVEPHLTLVGLELAGRHIVANADGSA